MALRLVRPDEKGVQHFIDEHRTIDRMKGFEPVTKCRCRCGRSFVGPVINVVNRILAHGLEQ